MPEPTGAAGVAPADTALSPRAIGAGTSKASNNPIGRSRRIVSMKGANMHQSTTTNRQAAKDTLKQQLIATIAGGNTLVAEELELLLKVAAPEVLPGQRGRH